MNHFIGVWKLSADSSRACLLEWGFTDQQVDAIAGNASFMGSRAEILQVGLAGKNEGYSLFVYPDRTKWSLMFGPSTNYPTEREAVRACKKAAKEAPTQAPEYWLVIGGESQTVIQRH